MPLIKAVIYPLLLFYACQILVAQSADEANEYFEKFAFAKAIADYEKLIEEGYNNTEIFKKLGDSHFFVSDYKNAAKWYKGLYLSSMGNLDVEYLHRYSLALKSIGQQREADKVLLKAIETAPDDLRVQKIVQQPNYYNNIQKMGKRCLVKPLKINSSFSDFAPAFYKNGIVFTSSRIEEGKNKPIHTWTQTPFLNLYFTQDPLAKKAGITSFSGKINTEVHESSAVFTKDGKTVYFTRNDMGDKDFGRDSLGVSRLKIVKAIWNDGAWGDIQELPFNGEGYSTANPALNNNGDRLYFASDMPGTYGKSDIFYVDISKNGTYGKPVHLGNEINTEGRESFPFLAKNGLLYFASDGHPGMGGLDIYAVKFFENNRIEVKNVGAGLNTIADDFGLIVDSDNGTGYFSSNRKGGKGNDDIYSFTERHPLDFTCLTNLSGYTVNATTQKPISGALLSINAPNGTMLYEATSNERGAFSIDILCEDKQFIVSLAKKDFENTTQEFNLTNETPKDNIVLKLLPSSLKTKDGNNLSNTLELYGVSFIRGTNILKPKALPQLKTLATYLISNPSMALHIRQHTDSRADDHESGQLSMAQANSIKTELLKMGVNANNLSIEGVGKAEILNHCIDGIECSESEHELNNRSEFLVVE